MNSTARSHHDHSNCTLFPQRKAFVLRFTDDAGPHTGAFRGRIEHVSSGEVATFDSPEELWAFVRDELTKPSELVHALPKSRGGVA